MLIISIFVEIFIRVSDQSYERYNSIEIVVAQIICFVNLKSIITVESQIRCWYIDATSGDLSTPLVDVQNNTRRSINNDSTLLILVIFYVFVQIRAKNNNLNVEIVNLVKMEMSVLRVEMPPNYFPCSIFFDQNSS